MCFSCHPLRKRVSRHPVEDQQIADWVRKKDRKKKNMGALNMTIEEFKKRLPQLNLADYELRL